MKVRNPRTGEADYAIAPLSSCAVADTAARLRQGQPDWARLTVEARGVILTRWAAAIAARLEDIAAALTADTGRAGISRI